MIEPIPVHVTNEREEVTGYGGVVIWIPMTLIQKELAAMHQWR